MSLSKRDLQNAKQLGALVKAIEGLKQQLRPQKLPTIGLATDPAWCLEQPKEAAQTITRLRNALIMAIAHLDAAPMKSAAYRKVREALVGALGGTNVPPRMLRKRAKRNMTLQGGEFAVQHKERGT